MIKSMKHLLAGALCGVLLAGAAPVIPGSPVEMVAEAHGGRTDSHGGHKDNKNASVLGVTTTTAAAIPPICTRTACVPTTR